ncbi:MAG: hypothetical protein FWD84_04610, partial [Oscillospiraceae bacterium]|nr:hypothetical protein [Oscillospiraceae bacterium]
VSYADGKTVEFAYNPLKQLTAMRDWLGTTQIEPDPLGRAVRVTDFDEKTVAYTWDSAGLREKIVYPDGKEVRYGYNPAGLLESVRAPEGETRYTYDQVGRIRERTLPDSTRSTYKFDALGRISDLTHRGRYDELDRFQYAYDPGGNIAQIAKKRKGLDADSGLFQYAYDTLGRLTSVTRGSDTQTFQYDALGNRTQSQHGGETTHYSYNAANQLIQTQTGGTVTDYGYDGRGNLTQITENGALKQQFRFDATNRMTHAVTAGVGQAAYTYDGALNRVKKLESAQEIRYILDRTLPYNNLLMTEGAQNQSFTWGSELISMSEQQDMFYLQDHLGSPIRQMGQFVQGIAQGYDVFGAPMKQALPNGQPFGFTGYQMDDVSGLYFAQARYYDAQAGRFVSEDVVKGHIAVPESLNAYAYCWNDPLTLVDLDGELPQFIRDAGNAVSDFWHTHIYGVREVHTVTHSSSVGPFYTNHRESVTRPCERSTGRFIVQTRTYVNGERSTGLSFNVPSIASVGATVGGGSLRFNGSFNNPQNGRRTQGYIGFGGPDWVSIGGTHSMTHTEWGIRTQMGNIYMVAALAFVAWKAGPAALAATKKGLHLPSPPMPIPGLQGAGLLALVLNALFGGSCSDD